MKIVKVTWLDTFAEVGWSSEELDPVIIVSVGFLLSESDKKVVLSGMGGKAGLGLQDSNCRQAIPRGCIVSIEILEDDDVIK